MERYSIRLDKQPFLRFYNSQDRAGITLGFEAPESKMIFDDTEEDFIIHSVTRMNGEDEEDITIEFITEYSNWYGAQGFGG